MSVEPLHSVDRIEKDAAKSLILAERLFAFDAVASHTNLLKDLMALQNELHELLNIEVGKVKAEFEAHSQYIRSRQVQSSRLQLPKLEEK